ncbi:MAG: hypothetical protein ACFFD4_11515 [Candidatus Odinarchaeota archaeon]
MDQNGLSTSERFNRMITDHWLPVLAGLTALLTVLLFTKQAILGTLGWSVIGLDQRLIMTGSDLLILLAAVLLLYAVFACRKGIIKLARPRKGVTVTLAFLAVFLFNVNATTAMAAEPVPVRTLEDGLITYFGYFFNSTAGCFEALPEEGKDRFDATLEALDAAASAGKEFAPAVKAAIIDWVLGERAWEDRVVEKNVTVTETVTLADNTTVQQPVTRTEKEWQPERQPHWGSIASTRKALQILDRCGGLTADVLDAAKDWVVSQVKSRGTQFSMDALHWEDTREAFTGFQDYFDMMAVLGLGKITPQVMESLKQPYVRYGTLTDEYNTTVSILPAEREVTALEPVNGSFTSYSFTVPSLEELFKVQSSLSVPYIKLTFDWEGETVPNFENVTHARDIGLLESRNETVVEERLVTDANGTVYNETVTGEVTVEAWNELDLWYEMTVTVRNGEGTAVLVEMINPACTESYQLDIDQLVSSGVKQPYTVEFTARQLLHSFDLLVDGQWVTAPVKYGENGTYLVEVPGYELLVDYNDLLVVAVPVNESTGYPDETAIEEYNLTVDQLITGGGFTLGNDQYIELLDIPFRDGLAFNMTATLLWPAAGAITINSVPGTGEILLDTFDGPVLDANLVLVPLDRDWQDWQEVDESGFPRSRWLLDGTGRTGISDTGTYLALVYPFDDDGKVAFTGEQYPVRVRKQEIIYNLDEREPFYRFAELLNTTMPLNLTLALDFDFVEMVDQFTEALAVITDGVGVDELVDIHRLVELVLAAENTTTHLLDNSLETTVKGWEVLERLGVWHNYLSKEDIDTAYRYLMTDLYRETVTVTVTDGVAVLESSAFADPDKLEATFSSTAAGVKLLVLVKEYDAYLAAQQVTVDPILAAGEKAEPVVPLSARIKPVPAGAVQGRGTLLEERYIRSLEQRAEDYEWLTAQAEQRVFAKLEEYQIDLAGNKGKPFTFKDTKLICENRMFWQVDEGKAVIPPLTELFVAVISAGALGAMVLAPEEYRKKLLLLSAATAVLIFAQQFVIPLTALSGTVLTLEQYLNVKKYGELLKDTLYEVSEAVGGVFARPHGTRAALALTGTQLADYDVLIRQAEMLDEQVTVEWQYGEYRSTVTALRNLEGLPFMSSCKVIAPDGPVSLEEFVSTNLLGYSQVRVGQKAAELADEQFEQAEKLQRNSETKNAFFKDIDFLYRSIFSPLKLSTSDYDRSKLSKGLIDLNSVVSKDDTLELISHMQKGDTAWDALEKIKNGRYANTKFALDCKDILEQITIDISTQFSADPKKFQSLQVKHSGVPLGKILLFKDGTEDARLLKMLTMTEDKRVAKQLVTVFGTKYLEDDGTVSTRIGTLSVIESGIYTREVNSDYHALLINNGLAVTISLPTEKFVTISESLQRGDYSILFSKWVSNMLVSIERRIDNKIIESSLNSNPLDHSFVDNQYDNPLRLADLLFFGKTEGGEYGVIHLIVDDDRSASPAFHGTSSRKGENTGVFRVAGLIDPVNLKNLSWEVPLIHQSNWLEVFASRDDRPIEKTVRKVMLALIDPDAVDTGDHNF